MKKGFGHVHGTDGASLWLRPGTQKHIPLYNSLDIAAGMIRHAGFAAISRGSAVDAVLSAHHAEAPHYYLFAIGNRPNKRGQGIGIALMNAGLAEADATHMPAYLESSKEQNIGFYQRFGFQVTERVQPTDTSPPLWLMWREAKSST